MTILNNQTLSYDHLLSYTCLIKKEELLKLVDFMCRNMNVLDNTVTGFPMIINENENEDINEILIPIKENRNEVQPEFKYKHDFRIENAISVRYIGSIENIEKAKNILMEYINANSLTVDGSYIYSIISINVEKDDNDNNIIDVYVKCL